MSQKDTRIAVLGDGGWGTALSLLLAGKGMRVHLWGAFPSYVEEVRRKRENRKFLPGFRIPERVRLFSGLAEAVSECRVVVLAVPSQFMERVLRGLPRKKAQNKIFVSVAKGIETRTLRVVSQVIHDSLGNVPLCVLSGPTIAREIAQKMPAAASIASRDPRLASRVRETLSSDHFNLYESSDVLGVQLGGALKNVIAIAAGIAEGLGYGSNTKAAIMARGLAEMARLGEVMGAKRQTFMGLSGLGDLSTTCLSLHSRNRWFGEEIGKGKSLRTTLRRTEMVVEGVETARAAYRLAKKYKVSMPIAESVHAILFRGHKPREAIGALMQRKPYRELD